MSESELIEDPQEITALYFPNEGGIQWQGEAYLPADYVLSRGQEPVAYALYDLATGDEVGLRWSSGAEIDKRWARVVPLYTHPETPEPADDRIASAVATGDRAWGSDSFDWYDIRDILTDAPPQSEAPGHPCAEDDGQGESCKACGRDREQPKGPTYPVKDIFQDLLSEPAPAYCTTPGHAGCTKRWIDEQWWVTHRPAEPVAYALWWPENVLHGVILASQISQFDYEKFRVVPLYAHPETPE